MKLKFEKIGSTGSDETAPYVVTTDIPCSVYEMICAILEQNEWGKISVTAAGQLVVSCKYKGRAIESLTAKNIKFLQSTVVKVNTSGVWGNMDYLIGI